jgi:NAD(P)H-dependent flavin oxidoreductase YrpB (nitropropane dioxygenase family)
LSSDFDSTITTLIFTGRPLRVASSPYIANWEKFRQNEIRELTSRGIIPLDHDVDQLDKEDKMTEELEEQMVKKSVSSLLY